MTARNRSVLVVEDDPMSLELITDLLLAAGWRVRAVMSGEDGVAATTAELPDLVLLDIGLPGMDGHETMRALRALPGGADLPIIAVTAQAMRGDEAVAVSEGFNGYITKPLETRRLVHVIEELLARGR